MTFIPIDMVSVGGRVEGYEESWEVMADHDAIESRWPWIHREIRRAEEVTGRGATFF